MTIRHATKEDCPAMLKLIHELAEYEKAPHEVTVDPRHFEESGFGEKPVWWALVAVADKSEGIKEKREMDLSSTSSTISTSSTLIIGFALYYIRYSTWKGQVMYLEDLLVTESMRGQGIGRMLIDQLIEEAKEKGFKRICWQVLDWNEPAINFYKKLGAKFDPEWVNVTIEC
jgi:GNAT superfamily N-acetyltransferase